MIDPSLRIVLERCLWPGRDGAVPGVTAGGGVLQKESRPLFTNVIAQDKGVKSRLEDDVQRVLPSV